MRAQKRAEEQAEVVVGGTENSTHHNVDASGRPKSVQQQKSFAADTAEKTGLTKSTINRKTAVAEALAPGVAEALRGTSLNTATETAALGTQASRVAPQQPPPR